MTNETTQKTPTYYLPKERIIQQIAQVLRAYDDDLLAVLLYDLRRLEHVQKEFPVLACSGTR